MRTVIDVLIGKLGQIKARFNRFTRGLCHPFACTDSLRLLRHQDFITSHILSGLTALALYPIYLFRAGGMGVFDLLVLAWFLSPFFIVGYLSRSGKLATAHLISSLNLAVFVMAGALLTGGLSSFLMAWLVIVPLEAALSGKKRVIVMASLVSVLALAGIFGFSQVGFVAETSFALSTEALLLFGFFTALTYGGSIAFHVQRLHDDQQRALSERERKYRLMAYNGTDLIMVHDQNGGVSFVSPAAETLIGVRPERLLGDGMFELIHVSDRPIYMTALSDCANRNEARNVEFRLKCTGSDDAGSEYVWMEMRCRVSHDGLDISEKQIVSVTRDISAHKVQERALIEASKRAESANVAKTRFLAHMSHELRTPLNAIIGFSDVLNLELYGPVENQKYKDYSRLIHEAGTHLLSVVNNILDMSKIEVGNFTILPESFHLPRLISTCSEMVEPLANDNQVRIVYHNKGEDLELMADSRAVKQMVLNLLSNAIKFSRPQGIVEIRHYVEGDRLFIEVKDTGIGISETDLPKLCNPFVQADSSYKREHDGVGLGLSVVKGLAQLHGGSFVIDSRHGVWTKATIELPHLEEQLTLTMEDGGASAGGQDADCRDAEVEKVVYLRQNQG